MSTHTYTTTLLELKDIIDANWHTIEQALRKADERYYRHDLLTDLEHLNGIRRVVMHPVRGRVPTEEDFDFLRQLKSRLRA